MKLKAGGEPEAQAFATPKAWAAWLKREHAHSQGLWIRFYKKASGIQAVGYAQALDEQSYRQCFTPRRARSVWSKCNREHVARLEAEGRMQAPGRAQVKAAMADGRWEQAYDSPAHSSVPQDLLGALAHSHKAVAFFESLNKAGRYAITWRLQTAKKTRNAPALLGQDRGHAQGRGTLPLMGAEEHRNSGRSALE